MAAPSRTRKPSKSAPSSVAASAWPRPGAQSRRPSPQPWRRQTASGTQGRPRATPCHRSWHWRCPAPAASRCSPPSTEVTCHNRHCLRVDAGCVARGPAGPWWKLRSAPWTLRPGPPPLGENAARFPRASTGGISSITSPTDKFNYPQILRRSQFVFHRHLAAFSGSRRGPWSSAQAATSPTSCPQHVVGG